jgi:hypothetical protein
MENFEEFKKKYNLLMKYLLVTANKCIKSIDPIDFISYGELYKKEKDTTFDNIDSDSLVPIININLIDNCIGPGIKVSVRVDVYHRLSKLNEFYFPNHNLFEDIRVIKVNK